VERLKLDALAAVFQQVHHHHEVLDVADVPHHEVHVRAVQQQVTQQLDGLPPRHVVAGAQQLVVAVEELRRGAGGAAGGGSAWVGLGARAGGAGCCLLPAARAI
jgi:hypothetical protein